MRGGGGRRKRREWGRGEKEYGRGLGAGKRKGGAERARGGGGGDGTMTTATISTTITTMGRWYALAELPLAVRERAAAALGAAAGGVVAAERRLQGRQVLHLAWRCGVHTIAAHYNNPLQPLPTITAITTRAARYNRTTLTTTRCNSNNH